MREIKFRGKQLENIRETDKTYASEKGTWRYGTYKYIHKFYDGVNAYMICDIYGREVMCDKETIGQFTGLHDKNGVEIYEGDLIRELGLNKTWTLSRRDEFSNRNHIVMWDEEELQWCGNLYEQSALEIYEMDTRPLEFLCKKYTIEVIGNIHEEVEE